MKLLRKFALVWMFAWLPVSGVMATTMPFCAQGMGGMMAATMAAESMNAMPCHEPQASRADTSRLPVEHCDLCHIAGALAPPSLPIIANDVPRLPPVDATVSEFRSFFPDPPQHPPHTSPA